MNADEVIALLGLEAHPEGGAFTRTYVHPETHADGRSYGSAIYYLLQPDRGAARHRIDADEMWHHYAGATVELIIEAGELEERTLLGDDLLSGARPQVLVPARAWQRARTLGEWSLVGCTVTPAFDANAFEMQERL